MECVPKPDHDWVDAEFLVFCSSGLSQLIYATLLSDQEDEEEEIAGDHLDIANARSANSNSLRVFSYFIYRANGRRVQISAMLKNKTRKAPLLYLAAPVSEVLRRVQTQASLDVQWMREAVHWDATYDYILAPYISIEADFQNLKLPADLHGKKKVTAHAKATDIPFFVCRRIFSLECEAWLKTAFQGDVALAMRYHAFFPSRISIVQLRSVYVHDFDYPLPPHRPTYAEAFQSQWYSEPVFLHFCRYVQFRERDPLVRELYHLWRETVRGKEWMDVHYFEILRETNNALWFDIDKEYRRLSKFSQQSDQRPLFLQRAGQRISRCLQSYAFPHFYYSRYNLTVSTDPDYYLAHRLCTYHPALFRRTRSKHLFPLLDTKLFNRAVGVEKGSNRKHLCLSAAKDTVFSNSHSPAKPGYLPCPVLLVHTTPQEKWLLSCTGSAHYYGAGEERDLGDAVQSVLRDAKGDASYICRHLTLYLSDLLRSEPTGFNYHEVVNPFLALTSIPFDLDLKGLKKPLRFDQILAIAQGVSQGVTIFLNIIRKEENHDALIPDLRTFVYKSACDQDGDTCTCTEKLGLRIIVRLPPNVLISNITALRSCANLIITLIKSHFLTLQIIEGGCDIIANVLDVNIWKEFKSHRLPLSYKDKDTRRLLPIFTLDSGLAWERADIESKLRSLLDPFVALIHRDWGAELGHEVFVCEGIPQEGEEEEEEEGRAEEAAELIAIKGRDKETTKLQLTEKADGASALSLVQRSLYMQLRQSKLKLAFHLFTYKLEEDPQSTYLRYNLSTSQGERKFPVCLQEDKKKKSNKVIYFILVKAEDRGAVRLRLMCKCFACRDNAAKCVLNWTL